MIGFNEDGSIKLPMELEKRKKENDSRIKNQRCIKIKRRVVNYDAPKKCVLNIILSDVINDDRFMETIFNYFKEKAAVPSKLTKIMDRQFEVEIGTDFKRCSDCNSLISRYREFFDGNIIEEKGTCTFEGRKTNFCYEDYFE
ncbi:MAG: hypothetical protein ABIJ08_05035 [Nanoarchaeota archaeon]